MNSLLLSITPSPRLSATVFLQFSSVLQTLAHAGLSFLVARIIATGHSTST